jgi:hypothetical protein
LKNWRVLVSFVCPCPLALSALYYCQHPCSVFCSGRSSSLFFSCQLSCPGSCMQVAEEEPSMAEQVSIVNSAKMFFCYFYLFWLDNGKNHLCFIVSDQLTWFIISFFNHPTLLFLFIFLNFCLI